LKKIIYWSLLLGPTSFYGLGALMNFLALAANGGQMPVLFPGGCAEGLGGDVIHTCMTSSSHFKFISDWIVVNHLGVFSPGDLLLMLWDTAFWPALFAWIILTVIDRQGA